MKTFLTIVSLFLAGGDAMADMSKDDIRQLLAARASDEAILRYVITHLPMEKLSPADVAELKGAGASDTLLKSLLELTDVVPDSMLPSMSTYAPTGDTYYYSSSYTPSYSYGYLYYPRLYTPPMMGNMQPRHQFTMPPRVMNPPAPQMYRRWGR